MASSPSKPSNIQSAKSVLVTGCSGFVGYHLVRHFVQDPSFSNVYGFSRSATQNIDKHVPGAQYISGDLGDHACLERLLGDTKPTIIVHAGAPSPTTGVKKDYDTVIVAGTASLILLAKQSPHVQALLYTSTSLLYQGSEHIDYTEDYPRATTDPKASLYQRAKAVAEDLIIKANNPYSKQQVPDFPDYSGTLATAALRFPVIYGTHDSLFMPGCLEALQRGETNFQVGNGENLWSYCSMQNAVTAHSLAARALLHMPSTTPIDGEVFNINDGDTHRFMEVARKVWKMAGHVQTRPPIEIPVYFVMGLANILEFMFQIFTFGTRRPTKLGRQQMEYACYTHTYNIEKARQRLGFMPKQNLDEDLRDAVQWFLKEKGWAKKLNLPKRV